MKTYFDMCDNETLFPETTIRRYFKKAPLNVKDLRKFFSQEWDRRNGNYFAKRKLMGHSVKGVDAKHYAYLDNDDLKKIYDEVMGDLRFFI